MYIKAVQPESLRACCTAVSMNHKSRYARTGSNISNISVTPWQRNGIFFVKVPWKHIIMMPKPAHSSKESYVFLSRCHPQFSQAMHRRLQIRKQAPQSMLRKLRPKGLLRLLCAGSSKLQNNRLLHWALRTHTFALDPKLQQTALRSIIL